MAQQIDNKALLESEIDQLLDQTPAEEAVQKLKSLLLETYDNSETRFKTIFEESTFGNKIIAADLRIIKVNHALIVLLGYSEEELLGSLITDIAHPDYVEDWKKLQNVLWADKKTSFSIDTCLLKQDGSEIWCHVTSIVFKDKAEDYGYTIIEDITVRKNYERIRTELDAKKDEFISIVSHELRTPLTTIKAINQLLEKAVSQDHTYYSFIRKSNHHIQRLERLITDLFDVTKIQAGSVQLDLSTFDLNTLLTECISGLQAIHPTHRIDYTPGAAAMVSADYFRIEQVVINLVSNAIKYSPLANSIEVSVSPGPDEVKVEVVDYGIGIDKKHIDKVFDRFYRIGEASHHFQGLGLGLYISSQIIARHNGKMGIQSEPGKGSTFWFTLPAAR